MLKPLHHRDIKKVPTFRRNLVKPFDSGNELLVCYLVPTVYYETPAKQAEE